MGNIYADEALFRQIAEASFEYGAFIGGKVGRQEARGAVDLQAVSFEQLLAGGWAHDKLQEIMRAPEDRRAERERDQRLRREI